MKVKFNHFERVAGLFVLVAIAGLIFSALGVAIKRGWLESRNSYYAVFENGDGLFPGTPVQMAGIRVGSVTQVSLESDDRIRVRFTVLDRFSHRMREDAQVQLVRPFVIGERILEIEPGTEATALLTEYSEVSSRESVDLMSLLSGRRLGPHLETFGDLLNSVTTLAQAFSEEERVRAFVAGFDQVEPLIRNMNTMSEEVVLLSRQMTKDENIGRLLVELNQTTGEINRMIPEMQEANPHLAQDIGSMITNLAILSDSFQALVPAMAEVAPDLPFASRRALEALDEAVVLLKAMQQNFFIRGTVRQVREEEAKDRRMPASQDPE